MSNTLQLIAEVLPNDDWRDRALCAQTFPDAFFPEKGESTRQIKETCQRCEVRQQCLQSALDNDERFGIWGGLTWGQRKKLKHPSPERTKVTNPDQPPRPVAAVPAQAPEGTAA